MCQLDLVDVVGIPSRLARDPGRVTPMLPRRPGGAEFIETAADPKAHHTYRAQKAPVPRHRPHQSNITGFRLEKGRADTA
jgi:hypothetical protein